MRHRVIARERWIVSVLLLLICAVLSSNSAAQNAPARFERLGSADGLPSMTVYDIIQDRQGFIWIATHNGICKYDGYGCTVYKHDPFDRNSLSENYVRTMEEDADGNLWIGTNGGGLNRLNPETETFTRYVEDPADTTSISSNDVGAIYAEANGTIWVASRGGTLDALDPETGRFEHHRALDPDVVLLDISRGENGNLWLASFSGLTRYHPRTREAHTFKPRRADPYVFRIAAGDSAKFWLASVGNGFYSFDRETGTFEVYPADPSNPHDFDLNYVQTLRRAADGTLWYGTRSGGMSRFDPATRSVTSYRNDPRDPRSLSNDDVRALFIDRSGVVWIGTLGGGVSTFNPGPRRFRHFRHIPENPNSLSHPLVQALHQDRNDRLWVGTYGNGLSRLSPDGRTFTRFTADEHPDSLQFDSIWDVLEDTSGSIWLATSVGLQRLDARTGHFSRYRLTPIVGEGRNMVTTLHEDRKHRLWMGTHAFGLSLFDRQTGTFTSFTHDPDDPQSISQNEIWSIVEDDRGRLWIGTEGGGVNRFDPEKETFRRFVHDSRDPFSLSQNSVRTIHQDSAGRLWFGSGSGLNLFDPSTESFTHYFEEDGLPDNAVVGIEEDRNGNLWISTLNGLCRFDPATEVFTVYDESDGLPISEFTRGTSEVTEDGTMYFGGTNGFVGFHPDSMNVPAYTPPVRLTALKINNLPAELPRNVSFTSEVRLDYDENFLTFEFAALGFATSREHRYAYRLAGIDDNWVYAGAQNNASYTNLDPGTYTFRVRAVGRDGSQADQMAAIRIVIWPPWWQTWWFRILASGMLLSGIWAVYRWRLKHVVELERTRNRIAGDLHDDIGSRMSSIALSVDLVVGSGEVPEHQRRRLTKTAERARLLVDDLRDTVWSIDADKDELTHLIDRIEQTADQILQGLRHRVHVPDVVPPLELEMDTRRNVLMLVKEALHNAARHSDASLIELFVYVREGRLIVRVEDDGRGFDENVGSGGYGTKGMRRRAEAIGADLEIQTEMGKGTSVQVDLDLKGR